MGIVKCVSPVVHYRDLPSRSRVSHGKVRLLPDRRLRWRRVVRVGVSRHMSCDEWSRFHRPICATGLWRKGSDDGMSNHARI